MKKSELIQIVQEEIFKIRTEGFQGDGDEGDGMSGFRGGSRTGIPANLSLSPKQTLDVLQKVWQKIPLGTRMHGGGNDRDIPLEIRTLLDKMGYQIIHK